MRKISVRVWHTKIESFVSPSQYIIIDKDGELSNDDCVIEQFTGLHDKNGVKIFEGDIIDVDDFGKYKVIWDDESACFFTVLIENTAIENFMYANHFQPVLLDYKVSIIGNIHHEQELLEK